MTYPRYIPKTNLLATWIVLLLQDLLALFLLSCLHGGHDSSHVGQLPPALSRGAGSCASANGSTEPQQSLTGVTTKQLPSV